MIVGACRAVQERDLKRILAYSTISALGVLMMLLGIGTREAITAALVYLVAHAGYKGALFLVAGAVDHETGTRDIEQLSGLRRAMPITAIAGGAAALSMAGVPLTLGFIGKDAAYEALIHAGPGTGPWAWTLATFTVLASILLGLAGLLAGLLPFRGAPGAATAAHEPPWPLWLPPLLLAAGGVIVGVVPSILDRPLAAAADAILPAGAQLHLALWHGVTPALLLSALTLAGVAILWTGRDVLRRASWRPPYGTEDLYTGGLALLDRLSHRIAPPLHSASLRSYVMVIVVTVIAMAGAALVASGGLARGVPVVDAAWHEILIVVVIVTGAGAAALARTTMAAVLSLGAVGYGVATIFLMFGAPDLAMTQFSIETLTVLIFVLVFRYFPSLGGLSPAAVRLRDAGIAAGIGILVAGLVLTVATTETAPALREYFGDNGLLLGHGRNIVNVILVDFRGFDTMGEITVLATAAIGVRALLGLTLGERGRVARPRRLPTPSPMFRTATRILMPLLLLFSVFLLLRGHNEPGGGFVGGLVAAAAFALYGLAYGVEQARRALFVEPLTLLGAGLLIAFASGLPALLRGQPFLTAQWLAGPVAFGTPVVFDVGVYLVVTGVAAMMIFSLAEER